MNNFRPISLTSSLAKIAKTVVLYFVDEKVGEVLPYRPCSKAFRVT